MDVTSNTNLIEEAVEALTEAQRQAVIEGRVLDCPYMHPVGTRCPNCARWPFKKGGAAAFVSDARAVLAKLTATMEKNDER